MYNYDFFAEIILEIGLDMPLLSAVLCLANIRKDGGI